MPIDTAALDATADERAASLVPPVKEVILADVHQRLQAIESGELEVDREPSYPAEDALKSATFDELLAEIQTRDGFAERFAPVIVPPAPEVQLGKQTPPVQDNPETSGEHSNG